jgi:hypothetical protein
MSETTTASAAGTDDAVVAHSSLLGSVAVTTKRRPADTPTTRVGAHVNWLRKRCGWECCSPVRTRWWALWIDAYGIPG